VSNLTKHITGKPIHIINESFELVFAVSVQTFILSRFFCQRNKRSGVVET